MAKRMDVGTSHHTPIKHAIMREFVGKEVRAANSLGWLKRLVWIDLTAGNAIPAYDAPWSDACSPGILASRAAQSGKPVVVDLCEKNPETYATLLDSLAKHLPGLGYRRTDEHKWRARNAEVRVWNRDGREVGTDYIQKSDAVLVLNDPNAITEWAMHRSFTALLAKKAKGIRTLSCVGFNVAGIKRTPFRRDEPGQRIDSLSQRSDWYDLIRSITDVLPDRLDLMLAGFTRDSSQWAYLFSSPKVWRDKGEEESVIASAFTVTGEPHDYEFAWYKRDEEKFTRLVDRRILTKSELEARENEPLPFDDSEGEDAA
ncbi:hypothetical protein [Streptomyces sp. NBC_01238]|uniref:hypothetical protein n=1 Tax=Streptomyces sp. NBC_01238 TaxID=2903791 RepID=UPI002F9196C5